jgi:ABC-type transport system involved in multi-copper enzyme maturation permease subunit
MSAIRIWAIAANGFREVIRDRIFYVIGFFALLLSLALRLLPDISIGTHQKIFLDLGLGAIALLGAIVAIFVGTGLINKEIDKRTVLVLIPKPLSRAELILGKHLGLAAVLAVMLAFMTVIYLGLLSWSQTAYSLPNLILCQFYLLLELSLLAALALALGVFTSSILATLLSFGIYLMGHISADLLKLGTLSQNESVEKVTRLIYLVLPDLERLNLKNELVYGLLPDSSILLEDALYGIAYTGIFLGIAIAIFSRREF